MIDLKYKVSKYIYAQKSCLDYIILNKVTGKRISTSIDLVNLIHSIQFESQLISDNDINLSGLIHNDILISDLEEKEREDRLLESWASKVNKEISSENLKGIEIVYTNVDNSKDEVSLENIVNIYTAFFESLPEDFMKATKIRICFLSEQEFSKIICEYRSPNNLIAFVDMKCILVINYERLNLEENQKLFLPTLRHEFLHLLLAENRYNLPFWLEEGLCELYSMRTPTEFINFELKNIKLADFEEIQIKKFYNIGEFLDAGSRESNFYMQCQSISGFLLSTLGEKNFWKVIREINCTFEIEELCTKYYKHDFKHLVADWKKFIVGGY